MLVCTLFKENFTPAIGVTSEPETGFYHPCNLVSPTSLITSVSTVPVHTPWPQMPTDFSLPEVHVHPSASVLLLILCPVSDYPSYPTSMFYPSFQSDFFADLGSRRDIVQYILLLLAPTCDRAYDEPSSLVLQ